jgi:deoxyribonuclease V
VAGIDQSFLDFKEPNMVISTCALLDFRTLKTIRIETVVEEVNFPYIPGYLMFREGEGALKAIERTITDRDKTIILVDGSGIAHPRKSGLASYIGLKAEIPAVGVTKKRLVGEHEEPEKPGEAKPLHYNSEIVGYALKTCKRCRPIYVSPGCHISLQQSLEVVKSCLKGYKLPEPIRIADKVSKERRKEFVG